MLGYLCSILQCLETNHYLWPGWHRRGMFFLLTILLIRPLKIKNKVLPNLKYQLKNKYAPQAKNFTKRYYPTHMSLTTLWHEFDNCLCNFLQSKVSRCLHMYFLWRHHLPPDKSENDQNSDSDWFIYCIRTYDCWHCFLVFNIWVSHALEITKNFHYPTLELFCFSFPQPFTHSKFCLPNPFLFGATPPPP
jgi:hypothetical protein